MQLIAWNTSSTARGVFFDLNISIPSQHISSGIRDNHLRGTVGDFLRTELRAGADLDVVTAYFTIFAYDKFRAHLDNLGRIRLLFGEVAFIHNLDPEHKDGAAYVFRDDGLARASGLNQRHIAQACATWIHDKVEVRSVTRTGFLHGKMSHIRRGEVSAAIIGSSNFTTRGLGLGATNNNVELNLIVESNRDRATANGSDMDHQLRLIRSAVESITTTFQQKLAAGLQTSRQFIPARRRSSAPRRGDKVLTGTYI
jgi:phosphatidylserine/phosphatidylglycerophosphate/cardiolipin synthase-like enzyme